MLTISPTTNLYTNLNCRKPCFKGAPSPNHEALVAEMESLVKSLNKAETAAGKYRETYLTSILNDLRDAFSKKKRIGLIETLKKLFKEQETIINDNTETLSGLKEGLVRQNKTLLATVGEQEKNVDRLMRSNTELTTRVKELEMRNEAFTSKTRPHVVNNSEYGLFRLTPKGLKQYMELTAKIEQLKNTIESIERSVANYNDRMEQLKKVYRNCSEMDQVTNKIAQLRAEQTKLSGPIGEAEAKIKVLQNTGELPEQS